MSRSVVSALVCLSVVVACNGRPRHEASGVSLSDTPASASETTDVYRFVGVEDSLGDAQKALGQEQWGRALVAARALLKVEPGHLEGQKIADKATFEAYNQFHFDVFEKSLAAKDLTAAINNFRQIGGASIYFERARPDYEKVREQWVAGHENDARQLAAKGRCRDAHHVAKVAYELFPEVRARLDAAADNCKPKVGQEADAEPVGAASPPSAPVASLQPVVVPPPEKAEKVESRPDAPAPPAPRPAAPSPPVAAPTPPAPAPPPGKPVGPKMIAPFELEKLRASGQRRPNLPAGANRIAHRDGVKQITTGVSLCVSAAGVPEHVELVKLSDYTDLNDNIVSEVSSWRFRPYLAGDTPVPVCTRIVFSWQLE